jgi:hypothetical protein
MKNTSYEAPHYGIAPCPKNKKTTLQGEMDKQKEEREEDATHHWYCGEELGAAVQTKVNRTGASTIIQK